MLVGAGRAGLQIRHKRYALFYEDSPQSTCLCLCLATVRIVGNRNVGLWRREATK